jgi:hypothetical protein
MRRHKAPDGGWCPGSGSDAWTGLSNAKQYVVESDDPMISDAVAELTEWWLTKAANEAEAVCAKAIEYGATDLRDLGFQILEMAGRKPHGDGAPANIQALATEIGIAFYAMGKLARIVAAVKEGRQPSYDSWHDLGVYARMAQRVHECGGWPG